MVFANLETRPPWIWPRAAYVHIPFCAHHCCYCDFAIAVDKSDRIDLYLDALAAELSRLEKPQPVQTIFFGGGTPTHLQANQLERLLRIVLRWLPLEAGGEFSVEANPGDFTAEKVAVLADHGVNRLSIGVQSFEPDLLRFLERDHGPAEIVRAVELARRRIDNISLDLIFGVPGQTPEQWHQDMVRALELEPDHVATYGLTYEKGTPLWKQRQRGVVISLDEDEELVLYHVAMDFLQEAGFEHYEISNFALSGKRCLHNLVYWANHAYFGFGMGAARYIDFVRELNTRDLHAYLQRCLAGQTATFQSEKLEPRERALETVAIQLRRDGGIQRESFLMQTGFVLDALLGKRLQQLLDLELLQDDGTSVRLTRSGKCVADAVITHLF